MIYVDILFLTNLTFDLISLYLASCVAGSRLYIPGMVFSGVVAAACGTWLLLECANLGIFLFVAALSFALLVWLTFRPASLGAFAKLSVLVFCFLLLSGAFSFWLLKTAVSIWGNQTTSGDARTLTFLVISSLTGLLLSFAAKRWKRAVSQETVVVEITVGEKKCSVECTVDSGHFLTDPLTGTPVLFLPDQAARTLIPDAVYRRMRSGEASVPETDDAGVLTRLRLIPFHTENGDGLLLCYRADGAVISGISKRAYLALRKDRKEARGLCPATMLT